MVRGTKYAGFNGLSIIRRSTLNHFIGDVSMTDRDKTMRDEGIENSTKGKVTEAKGRVKDALGGLTGDVKLQAQGKIDQVKGKAQDAIGKAQRKMDK